MSDETATLAAKEVAFLPTLLREHLRCVLTSECEPHVIDDAVRMANLAADFITKFLQPTEAMFSACAAAGEGPLSFYWFQRQWEAAVQAAISDVIAAPSQPSRNGPRDAEFRQFRGEAPAWPPLKPINQWPEYEHKDDLVLLLVEFEDHSTEDATFALTVGGNNDHNVGDGEGVGWQFAGWCWTHDHWTDGVGTPVAFAPLPHDIARAKDAEAREGASS